MVPDPTVVSQKDDSPSRAWDVLGLGCMALDHHLVVPSFPGPDEKVPVLAKSVRPGGTTGGALAAAAAYGARAGFAGAWNERFSFAHPGVDFTAAMPSQNSRPIECWIWTTPGSPDRRVIYSLENVAPLPDAGPAETVVAATQVLLVDHFGMTGMIAACRHAKRHGVAIVADFESDERPEFAELLSLPEHVILSWPFAGKITGASSPAEAALMLSQAGERTAVVTNGEHGGWCVAPGTRAAVAYDAVSAAVRHTCGCGDVFHGIYAATLAEGRPLEERIARAATAAALWSAQDPTNGQYPTRKQIESRLNYGHGPASFLIA